MQGYVRNSTCRYEFFVWAFERNVPKAATLVELSHIREI